MNILEEIQNCPVEWKELGEVSQFYSGLTGKTKTDFENGTAKYVTYKNIFNNIQVELNILENVQVDKNEKQNSIEYGDVLITGSSESKEEVGMSSTVTFVPDEQIYLNSFSFGIRFNEDIELLPEFTKYLFRSIRLRKQIEKTASGVTRYNISKVAFKKIKIPIPPLEIQEKIIQTLDKFTDYVTELTSELTSRKKQYSYYRDKLLSFEDEVYQVEWKTLGEVAENLDNMRKPVAKGGRSLGIYPYYGASGIVDYVDSFIFDGDYLLISEDGANLVVRKTPIAFSISGKTWVNNHAHVLKFDNIINQKFVNYYLNYLDLSPYITGAAQSKLNQQNLNNIKIPYPSLEIQSRIVQVLDNFDTVCNDLNIGLPKEIELRQKQYEFFREKLLTFTAEGVYTESRVEEWDNSAILKLLQWVFGPIRAELGSVFEVIAGGDIPKNGISAIETEEYCYPILSNGMNEKSLYGWTNQARIKNPSLTVSARGTIGWTSYREKPFFPIVRLLVLTPKINLNLKYAYYFMNSIENNYEIPQSGIPQLTKPMIKSKIIILPPLEKQSSIVSILDNFNTLTNSISEGLPKEIEQRQKQYEYWREQLLNFDL